VTIPSKRHECIGDDEEENCVETVHSVEWRVESVEWRVESVGWRVESGEFRLTFDCMQADIQTYHKALAASDREICDKLHSIITTSLKGADHKIWHAHPVWFIDGNPIVGYHKLKGCVRLLFWSGQSFDEEGLAPEGTFKAAEKRYTDVSEVKVTELKRWLVKSKKIQWDYNNIVKRRGKLVRIANSE